MILLNDHGLAPYAGSLDKLYIDCFDGLPFSDSDPAEIRSITTDGQAVISQAAIKQCKYDFIDDPLIPSWILGYVCTNSAYRGRGLASACLRELFDALLPDPWIMVLNCKWEIAPFYEKCGFEIIAEKASYDRNGTIAVDDDPVMAKCSARELKTAIVKNAVLHLGEEF